MLACVNYIQHGIFPPCLALMKALEWGTLENQKTKKKNISYFYKV